MFAFPRRQTKARYLADMLVKLRKVHEKREGAVVARESLAFELVGDGGGGGWDAPGPQPLKVLIFTQVRGAVARKPLVLRPLARL